MFERRDVFHTVMLNALQNMLLDVPQKCFGNAL